MYLHDSESVHAGRPAVAILFLQKTERRKKLNKIKSPQFALLNKKLFFNIYQQQHAPSDCRGELVSERVDFGLVRYHRNPGIYFQISLLTFHILFLIFIC